MPLEYETIGEALRRFAEAKRQRTKREANRTKKWNAMRSAMIAKRSHTHPEAASRDEHE